MKTLLLFALFSLSFNLFFAQDTIVKLNGTEIQSKVISVGTSEVNYKKFNNIEGPMYTISISEIHMIKYKNGTSDVLNEKKTTENIKEVPSSQATVNEKKVVEQTKAPAQTGNYIDKVRAIQAKDPSVAFYLGNGFLGGQGLTSPLFGLEFRLPKKNVFVRGISIGARASFTGLGEDAYDRQQYTEIYGFGLSAKYYAPLPIKTIQPYIVTVLGGAYRNYYVAYEKIQSSSDGYSFWAHNVTSSFGLYSGFGVGCNFMFLRHLGGFVEMGYFTTAYINVGLTIKIGPTEK